MDFNLDDLVGQVLDTYTPDPKFAEVPTVPGLVAHIDGDLLAYFAGTAPTPGAVRSAIQSRVARLKKVSGAETVVMHLTCGGSHKGERYLIAESRPYQGNRKKAQKPKHWQFARDLLTDHDGKLFKVKTWTTREADDGMAYITNYRAEQGILVPIMARDKDMRVFPGIHFDWETWERIEVPLGAYEVHGSNGLLYGAKWFWWQMIEGDTADHIPGIPKGGPALAEQTLSGTTCNADAYAAVAALYARRLGEGWERYLVEQAALLWMRQDRDASPLDFLRLGVFPHNVQEAAWHMADRVRLQRQHLESLRR